MTQWGGWGKQQKAGHNVQVCVSHVFPEPTPLHEKERSFISPPPPPPPPHLPLYTHTHTSLLPIHTQEFFSVKPYMSHQLDITAAMRTILVDWLIEVQENFELFHETLYLAVKLVDLYLMRREVKREYLQLVGATCMLIAAKF